MKIRPGDTITWYPKENVVRLNRPSQGQLHWSDKIGIDLRIQLPSEESFLQFCIALAAVTAGNLLVGSKRIIEDRDVQYTLGVRL